MFSMEKVDSEITNRCNAACPLCARTGTYSGGVSKELNNSGTLDISLDVVEEILYMPGIRKWQYCGNYGDPLVHPKVFEIAEMVRRRGVKTQQFDTNGSMRSPKFWKDFARIGGMEVNFALDGLSDTNMIYRAGTNFEKIIENARAFISGGGKAHWQFIVFDHNEHQVDEAREMAKRLGFTSFKLKKTARRLSDKQKSASKEVKKTSKSKVEKKTISATKKTEYQADIIKEGLKQFEIRCKAQEFKKMYVTPKGEFIPCCHVHQDLFKMAHNAEYACKNDPNNFLTWLEDNDIMYDLNKHSIFEVMDSYNKNFASIQKRWGDRSITSCNKKCGSNQQNHVFQETI